MGQGEILDSKSANSEQYIASSIIRFGRLDNYIQEKILVDQFAVKGNLKMIEGLEIYIKENLEDLKNSERIRLLDVGPAIGAFSSMLALQALNKFGLLEKTQIHMVDVSKNVIEKTQTCQFTYPDSLIDPKLKGRIFKKLRESKSHIGSAESLPWKDEYFTITLAGFVFHHMHDSIKAPAASEVMRTLKTNGFLGVAEEWFKDYEQDYAIHHKEDQIPLALESIISFKRLSKIFEGLEIFHAHDKRNRENSYSFCGVKG